MPVCIVKSLEVIKFNKQYCAVLCYAVVDTGKPVNPVQYEFPINNAIKYTAAGGSITAKVKMHQGKVCISVADTGIGILPTLLPQVFDLFTQGERSPDRSQGGLGLGLALVKSLVELHGGTVSTESSGKDLGCTFTVTLPRLTF